MQNIIAFIAVFLFSTCCTAQAASVSPATGEAQCVDSARQAFLRQGMQDVLDGADIAEQCALLHPTSPKLRFLAATGEIARLLFTSDGGEVDSLRELFAQCGMQLSGAKVDDLEAVPQSNSQFIPYHDELLADYLLDTVLPGIENALRHLNAIDDGSFKLILPKSESGFSDTIEVDYGDVVFLRSVLMGLKSWILFSKGLDLEFDICGFAQLCSDSDTGPFGKGLGDLGRILKDTFSGPTALRRVDFKDLEESKALFKEAVNIYTQASQLIRQNPDGTTLGSEEFISIETDMLAAEELFRSDLQATVTALNTNSPVQYRKDGEPFTFSVSMLFNPQTTPSFGDLLPRFDIHGYPISGSMGRGLGSDASLGGLLPDMTSRDWDVILSDFFDGLSGFRLAKQAFFGQYHYHSTLHGKRVFAEYMAGGIGTYDVRNPNRPYHIDHYGKPGASYGPFETGTDTLYALSNGTSLVSFDLSEGIIEGEPFFLADMHHLHTMLAEGPDLFVFGHKYVGDTIPTLLSIHEPTSTVIDVASAFPSVLTAVAYNATTYGSPPPMFVDCVLDDDRLFALVTNYMGIHALLSLDVTDPSAPAPLAYTLLDAFTPVMAVRGDTLYAYSPDKNALSVFDIAQPGLISFVDDITIDHFFGEVTDMAFSGKTLIAQTFDGLAAYDCSVPHEPAFAAFAHGEMSAFNSNLTIIGRKAYLLHDTGMEVYDIGLFAPASTNAAAVGLVLQ